MISVYDLPKFKFNNKKFGETRSPKNEDQIPEYSDLLKRQPARPGMKDLAEKIIPYGQNNAFPLMLAQMVQESPTASACIQTISDFIQGSGFSDKTTENLIINDQGDSFQNIHAITSANYSLFDGFALNIKYNSFYKISEIYSIPFENCRLAIPDENGFVSKIRYNPYYGTSQFLRSWTQEYDVFNPDPAIVAKQISDAISKKEKYKGQILYFSTTKPLSRFYSYPNIMSAQYWMQIDSKIGQFHANNLNNGFFQSILMRFVGDPSLPSNHPDDWYFDEITQQRKPKEGTNIGTRMDDEMQQFTGSDRSGNIMVQWAKSKDEFPDILPFPQNYNQDYFDVVQKQVTDNICIATQVPSIIAAFSTGKASLGGEGNLIRAGVKIMQQRTVKKRIELEKIYKDILLNWKTEINSDVNITLYNPFPEIDKVDQFQWAALTPLEQRMWLKENTDFPINLNNTPSRPTPPVKPPMAIPQAKFVNMSFTDYPDSAKKNIQEAMRFKNSSSLKCGTSKGWKIAQDIIDGSPLSYKVVKKIYSFLKKNIGSKNKLMSEDCNAILFKAWGGQQMLNWCEECINKIEK